MVSPCFPRGLCLRIVDSYVVVCVFERDYHFGFVWVCDDENAEAECRRPTNPVDRMFDFTKIHLK